MTGPDITWLTPDLATGADLGLGDDEMFANAQALVEMGVTHVCDLRSEDEDSELWEAFGVRYLNLGTIDDEGHHIPAELFDKVVEFADECQSEQGRLLVHCHMGVNRGPSAAVAVMMDRGWNPLAAFYLIRDKRPQSAVYYFMDAYDAHIQRRELTRGPYERRRIMKAWEKEVGDPKVIKHVNKHVAAHHKKDAEYFKSLR